MQHKTPVTVLTGAGISVKSGLPVYRDEKGNWIHKQPVQGPKFRASAAIRQRYWCRSYFGWQAFSRATPNDIHRNLTALEQSGFVSHIITQNVDGLHEQAGSKVTVALHGNLSEVICLNCGDVSSRDNLQTRLHDCNPDFLSLDFEVAPDGDANVEDYHIQQFNIAACEHCDGTLQPNVIFYGDNVPKARVSACMENTLNSGLLICMGTSLMVYSGYRFCKAAHEANIPLVIVNRGATRADQLALLKVDHDCNTVLTKLTAALL